MRVKCKDGCPWEAYCANIKGQETWQLRTIMDKRTCSRDYKIMFLNSKWLGKKIQSNVRENQNLKLSDIMEKTHEKWNVGINKTLTYRAKTFYVDIVDGSFREQYRRIHDYGHELLKANP
ncbi:unnamed protein product [Lathyrus oleraceus]